MNGLFAYHTNQSNLNRFITVSNWNEKDINKIKIKMINQVENGGVVVIDDTITKKYGKEMFGTDWHYDHTKGKDVWGIQIADCVLSGRGIHPLLSTVYIRNNSRWLNDHTKFKTKIEIQKTHLTELVDMGLKFSTVVMDIWYFCKELTDHIESLHKDWTAQCKSNRLVLYDGKWIDLRTFANIMMEKEEFKIAQIGEDQYLVKVFTVIMKSIGEVRLLISHNKHFEYKFYVSNRLN